MSADLSPLTALSALADLGDITLCPGPDEGDDDRPDNDDEDGGVDGGGSDGSERAQRDGEGGRVHRGRHSGRQAPAGLALPYRYGTAPHGATIGLGAAQL